MKRRQPDSGSSAASATPKKRRTGARDQGPRQSDHRTAPSSAVDQTLQTTPSRPSALKKHAATTTTGPVTNGFHEAALETDDSGSPTPKAPADPAFRTPQKSASQGEASVTTPSKSHRADKSAKRKSASALLERDDEEDWEGEHALAQEILDDDDEPADGQDAPGQPDTPSKKGRGRPKGSRNRRSPTPDGDIAPEERYFFQNRAGPPHVSNNTLASLTLLTHDEYFEQIRTYIDRHDAEKKHLMKLHARSFLQWHWELSEGYNICLYGWGSKRQLVHNFAAWLYPKHHPPPKMVVVNGYTPKLNMRTVLSTLTTAVMGDNTPPRLVGQPNELLDVLVAHLALHPPSSPVLVMINAIDAPSLRRPATQSLLARLAAHPSINVVATTDTPSFTRLWNSALRDQFHFVFHDGTTYAPYDAELSVVDDVHDLLGRKGRRVGGKEGVGFVLKSLPENARNLYRVLLTEILASGADGTDDAAAQHQQHDDEDGPPADATGRESDEQLGIDLRSLYQTASEEFICSSEMNFRTLLKEFHDHEMIVSRRDASGTEVLSVPLGREDMEGVLEDLVLG